MDIVDVDEALKDDSFIFLEDKTHDDISNILQQWRSSNCTTIINNRPQHPQQQQPQQEQVYKYDSRTFTRPKRKSAQNLGLQFTNNTPQYQSNNQRDQNDINTQTDKPMLNVEIGGLVTNMNKSFLQDTSPPPFSSVDASTDPMNNSLITSADFTNINFLQSTSSLDFGTSDAVGFANFNLTDKITSDGYSLSDMIRDRKALESLTMSSDGTLIKDSHIGQIDDISLTISKTASDCSTMDNSTESVEVNNRTVEIINSNMNGSLDGGVQLELAAYHGFKTLGNAMGATDNQILNDRQRTIVLSDEMIGDITYNLVENSMHASIPSDQVLSVTQNFGPTQNFANEVIPPTASVLNETVCVSAASGSDSCLSSVKTGNSTFDSENVTPDMRCETPEGVEKNTVAMKYYESTPHASGVRYNKQHYTPKLKIICGGSISPIIATPTNAPHGITRILNETFENDQQRLNATNDIVNTNTFSGKLALMTTVEMIENVENPTCDKTFKRLEQQSPASLEMKNVMDLAEAEANLLASNNNEEEFDHMLDKFSKVELNAEQLKMKKSLDSIKRRFNYGPNRDKSQQREISREAKDMRDMIRGSEDILGQSDPNSKDYLNMTMDIVTHHTEHLLESPHALGNTFSEVTRSPLKDSPTVSSTTDSKLSNGLSLSSASAASNGGERLLSRRSRLYDDFNTSTLSSSSAHGTKTSLASSFTVQSEDDGIGDIRPNITCETENFSDQNPLKMVQEKTETTSKGPSPSQISDNSKESTSIGQYKLAEKRERDRDRFKTIKINRIRNVDTGYEDGLAGSELNVPCIDDYPLDGNVEISGDSEQMNQRFSRRDQTASPVFNNNKLEIATNTTNKITSKINPNFLTYKKPKDKPQSNVRNLAEVVPAATTVDVAPEVASFKPRSLSRPRYLSGLTKFSAVCKATSADELEKTTPRLTSLNTIASTLNVGLSKVPSAANVSLNRTQTVVPSVKQSGELKSPMGIKSKSFHNLSSHHTYSSTTTNTVGCAGGPSALKGFGFKKPSVTAISTEKLTKINPNRNSCLMNPSSTQQQLAQEKSDASVFKVPKHVSGIRAPGAAIQGSIAVNRAGLVRPSSGYYSLTVTSKGVQPANSDADCDAGRHSPTDSMSSASSKGSAQSLNKNAVLSTTGVSNNSAAVKSSATTALTKIAIGSTGIPKPSGLRPPSNLKRSGLPRPSSFIKTDK